MNELLEFKSSETRMVSQEKDLENMIADNHLDPVNLESDPEMGSRMVTVRRTEPLTVT